MMLQDLLVEEEASGMLLREVWPHQWTAVVFSSRSWRFLGTRCSTKRMGGMFTWVFLFLGGRPQLKKNKIYI